jgi:hypothetical protein
MGDIIERAETVLDTNYVGTAKFAEKAFPLMVELVAELKRLHSWDGLLSLLDEHYPEAVFPTDDDREDRDSGPRIISLMRQINFLRSANQV